MYSWTQNLLAALLLLSAATAPLSADSRLGFSSLDAERPQVEAGASAELPLDSGGSYSTSTAECLVAAKTALQACFLAGTPVQTANGPQCIETMATGTFVFAFDFDSHTWKQQLVVALLTHEYVGEIVVIVVNERIVKATGNHPFWVIEGNGLTDRPYPADLGKHEQELAVGGRWVEARDLQLGDVLLSQRSGPVRVDGLTVQRDAVPVFNIEVAELHNYSVGDLGILVHNKAATRSIANWWPYDQ